MLDGVCQSQGLLGQRLMGAVGSSPAACNGGTPGRGGPQRPAARAPHLPASRTAELRGSPLPGTPGAAGRHSKSPSAQGGQGGGRVQRVGPRRLTAEAHSAMHGRRELHSKTRKPPPIQPRACMERLRLPWARSQRRKQLVRSACPSAGRSVSKTMSRYTTALGPASRLRKAEHTSGSTLALRGVVSSGGRRQAAAGGN